MKPIFPRNFRDTQVSDLSPLQELLWHAGFRPNDHEINEWSASTQTWSILVAMLNAPNGFAPYGVALDSAGNVYIADTGNHALKELQRAFVSTAPSSEGSGAGNDALSVVLPTTESLSGLFAPTSDQSWMTVGAISNGQISFNFTANTGSSDRTAHLTVLGQSITVIQADLGSQLTSSLQDQANVAGLPQGTQNSFDSKLQTAMASFSVGHTAAAENELGAFINYVSAQRDVDLLAALADGLIADALSIISAVG
jgi:hypothetical protein